MGPTGTFFTKNIISGTKKSVDKVFGQGSKALKPGKIPGLGKNENIKNAWNSTKGITEGSSIGSIKSTNPSSVVTTNSAKIADYFGERPMKYSIQHAYNQGVQDAIEKVANPMAQQQAMMDPMAQQQMMMDPMAQQQAMMQEQQAMMAQQQQMPQEQMMPPVAPGMQDAQMMQQGQVEAPGQPTMEEMQEVQDSGITSNDIASAAKVIQTMAEMKANADIMGMQPTPEEAQMAAGQQGPQPMQPPQGPRQVSMGVRG